MTTDRRADKRTELPVLYRVVEVISEDDVTRVERLECGHTKTTLTASQRPARRRRCLKCQAGPCETERECDICKRLLPVDMFGNPHAPDICEGCYRASGTDIWAAGDE